MPITEDAYPTMSGVSIHPVSNVSIMATVPLGWSLLLSRSLIKESATGKPIPMPAPKSVPPSNKILLFGNSEIHNIALAIMIKAGAIKIFLGRRSIKREPAQ